LCENAIFSLKILFDHSRPEITVKSCEDEKITANSFKKRREKDKIAVKISSLFPNITAVKKI
jgi:hypothetical protein